MVPQCFKLALTAGKELKELIHFNRGGHKGKTKGEEKGKGRQRKRKESREIKAGDSTSAGARPACAPINLAW